MVFCSTSNSVTTVTSGLTIPGFIYQVVNRTKLLKNLLLEVTQMLKELIS